MKQIRTFENDMMLINKNAANDNAINNMASLPGKQIVNNIMGYARSLQVLKRKNGDVIFLAGN